MDDLDKFLKFLYGTDLGYVWAPLKPKRRKPDDPEWSGKFFQWPSQEQELKDWVVTASKEGDVYIAPSLFETKGSKKPDFKSTNVVWVEYDGKEGKPDFKDIPHPDLIVQTSSDTHFHCYWKVERINQISVVEDINRRLMYHLGADSSGWDGTQILRPPLTTNYKHNLPVKLVHHKPPLFKHSFEQFDNAPEIIKPAVVLQKDELIDIADVFRKNSLPEALKHMVTSENVVHPYRSTFLMRVGYLLAAANLTEEEIVSCLYVVDQRIKKFHGREDQLLRLGEIAGLAVLDAEQQLRIEGFSPREILSNEQRIEWLVENWLHTTGIMLVSGAPSVGKTQFCFHLGYCLATGQSFMGKAAVPPIPVAFLSLEMEIVELKYIVEHQYEAFKDKEYDLYNANFRAFAPDSEQSFASYERLLSTFKPRVLIIDSLSELAQDDLKESEARTIMAWVRKIRKEYNCAIILIHHNRKASDGNKRPRKLSDLYGSFVFGKLSETVLSLWDLERDNLLEIDPFKVRFGRRETIRIERTPQLTFNLKETPRIEVKSAGRRSGETGDSNPLLNLI